MSLPLDFLLNFLNLLKKLILSLPLFNYKDIDSSLFKFFVSDINRTIVFIIGTTVTANVYLFTTKNKISSSSLWTTKQIHFLTINLVINFAILILGIILNNYNFLFGSVLTGVKLLVYLKLFSVLFFMSVILYGVTLFKFIRVFNINKSINRLYKKVQLRLYKYNQISMMIKLFSKTFNEMIFQFNMYKSVFNQIHKNHKTKIPLKLRILIYKDALLKAWKESTKHLFNVQRYSQNHSSSIRFKMTSRNVEKLSLDLEIYSQKIEYLLGQNSLKSVFIYFSMWNNLIMDVSTVAFHITSKKTGFSENLKRLYYEALSHHSRMILLTSEKYEYKRIHRELIKTLFKAKPYLDKDLYNMSPQEFAVRDELLKNIYYNELYLLFVNLIEEEDLWILDLIQSEEFNVISFIEEKEKSNEFTGQETEKNEFEDLFISIMHIMIQTGNTEKISSVVSILFSIFEIQKLKSRDYTRKQKLMLTKTKQGNNLEFNEKIMHSAYSINHQSRSGLIHSIIKANELEKFDVAGYLTKIISTNVRFNSFFNIYSDIIKKQLTTNKISGVYSNEISTTYFNTFSFKYCVGKTFLLTSLQYFYKASDAEKKLFFEDEKIVSIFKSLFKDLEEVQYVCKKLELKKSQYGMLSLEKETIDSFVKLLEKSN